MNTQVHVTHEYTFQSQEKYSTRQLILPLDISIKIDKNDPVVSFNEVMEGIDLTKYLWKEHRGRQEYNPFMMIKVVLFAYMSQIYSLRKMEEAIRNDIRFMWLAEEAQPSHMAIKRFIDNKLNDNIENIFHDVLHRIIELDEVDTSTIYVDGTKLQANARKFSFVWKKTAIKTRDKTFERLNEAVKQLHEYLPKVATKDTWTLEDVEELKTQVIALSEQQGIPYVYGKGTRKTAIQRIYDKIDAYYISLESCLERIAICGDRNSYSKSDHDATMMHLKEDYYMKTGVFYPAYNIQIGVSDEYIMHATIHQDRADQKTLLPFLEEYKRYCSMYELKNIVADAGYASYDNYFYCLENKWESYIKYNTYRIEKTPKYKKKIYNKNNFERNEHDEYICPEGKIFMYAYATEDTRSKYYRINEYYENDCAECPVKKQCTKAKDNRKIVRNPILEEFQTNAKTLLDSDEGIRFRIQRSIQVEGAFGVIKQDYGYDRIQRRGLKNVRMEVLLVCLGYNLKKYHNKKYRSTIVN